MHGSWWKRSGAFRMASLYEWVQFDVDPHKTVDLVLLDMFYLISVYLLRLI